MERFISPSYLSCLELAYVRRGTYKGIATISTYTYAKGLGIPFFAKFSVFNFFVPLTVSSIHASSAYFFHQQIKEFQTVDFPLSVLAHISPIEWSNVILYGEYKLNRDLVRR